MEVLIAPSPSLKNDSKNLVCEWLINRPSEKEKLQIERAQMDNDKNAFLATSQLGKIRLDYHRVIFQGRKGKKIHKCLGKVSKKNTENLRSGWPLIIRFNSILA